MVQDGVDGIATPRTLTAVSVPLASGNIPDLYTTTTLATTRSPGLPWLQDQEKREGEEVHDAITTPWDKVYDRQVRLLLI